MDGLSARSKRLEEVEPFYAGSRCGAIHTTKAYLLSEPSGTIQKLPVQIALTRVGGDKVRM